MEQIARELDITSTMLYNWRRKYEASELKPTKDSPLTAEQRIKQLELENKNFGRSSITFEHPL
ncbi:transposase [Pleionea sediminis]|uniref:transposase n=1 Tax=Pleionea sediminis TaxID=2569479 RepID=UPI001185C50A|nr:transposase [Pleionea sediminis]